MARKPARSLLPFDRPNPDASRRWPSCALLTPSPVPACRPARSTRVLSELVDEIGGNAQVARITGAEKHARLDVAVKIRAAGHHQPIALRQPQILLGIAARVIAVVRLDRVQPGIAEFG